MLPYQSTLDIIGPWRIQGQDLTDASAVNLVSSPVQSWGRGELALSKRHVWGCDEEMLRGWFCEILGKA